MTKEGSLAWPEERPRGKTKIKSVSVIFAKDYVEWLMLIIVSLAEQKRDLEGKLQLSHIYLHDNM